MPGSTSKSQLAREARHAQRAQRVVRERRAGRRRASCAAPRSASPPCGSIKRRRSPSSGRAIALIVKSRSARSSSIAPAQRRDVGLPRAVARDHAPCAEPLRQREHERVGCDRRARAPRARRRRRRRGRARRARSPEQRVAHRAADEPGVDPAQRRRARRARRPSARAARRARSRRRCTRGTRAEIAARDLVVDRAERARQLLGGDALVAVARRSGSPRRRRRPPRRPTSTVMLSMLIVPDDGTAAPADQHVGRVGQAAPVAVAVADRQHRDARRRGRRSRCARSRRCRRRAAPSRRPRRSAARAPARGPARAGSSPNGSIP